MKTFVKLLLYSLVFIFLTSCAKIYWGYKYADYYAGYETDKFFDFDSQQKKEVKNLINKIYLWHRYEELPKIIENLREISGELEQEQKLNAEIIDKLSDYYNSKRLVYAKKWYGEFAKILVTLNQEQIEHLKEELDETNQKILDDLEKSDEELREKYVESSFERYEEYVGKLSKQQEEMIDRGIVFSRNYRELSLESRIHSQKIFLQILNTEKSPKIMAERLYDITENPESIRIPKYHQMLMLRRKTGKAKILKFSQTLSTKQKLYFKKYIENLLSDLTKLSNTS